MNDPSCSKVNHEGYVLAFLAEIHLVDGNVSNFLKVKRFVFSAQMCLVNPFDSIPAQPCKFRRILNGHNAAQINNESFQRSGVVLFRVGKSKTRLFDGAAILALKPGNLNNQFDLSATDGKCLEDPLLLAKSDDIAGFTMRTFQIIRVNTTMEDGLAAKKIGFSVLHSKDSKRMIQNTVGHGFISLCGFIFST
jgi:hypothetical protein